MHHAVHPSAAKKFNPHQLKSARRLLRNILEHPDDIMGNIRQYVNSWIVIFYTPRVLMMLVFLQRAFLQPHMVSK